ncbi:MAG: transposase [Pseudomonadota bacterium]
MAEQKATVPFVYEDETFFAAYEAMEKRRAKRESQRTVATQLDVSRERLRYLESRFTQYGTVGLLPEISTVEVDPRLEKLVVLVKSARPHEHASLTLRLAEALEIPGASLQIIRHIQRCHGYGQKLDSKDISYFEELQHILDSAQRLMQNPSERDQDVGLQHFLDFEHDHMQQRVELFKELSSCQKRRQIRPLLRQFGIHPNRYYVLKERYLTFGVWGLIDRVQTTKKGEKLSAELELQIIEQRLLDPSLSVPRIIKTLQLKCCKSLVQNVYNRWTLSRFKKPIPLRGVISQPVPEGPDINLTNANSQCSAKTLSPNLVDRDNLKVNSGFNRLIRSLAYRQVSISNPGAILIAPFLDQLGVVEAMQTYGPPSLRSSEATNHVIVNTLRIIAGFPTIHDFSLTSDRSVAVGAGLSLAPSRSCFYDSFDSLRFDHLQKLRNDAACRARELDIIEGKQIAIDYHCDPSDSRFPKNKCLSKAPDKNGNLVYAHRPHIIWDSVKNTVINIAYCEGRSRGPSALYKFCEENLFKVIDRAAIAEIYADSEYKGEKQLVYLTVRTDTDVTMCLKQNPKIKKWREQTINEGNWQPYGKDYRIATKDFTLAETGKPFRFIVKQHMETNETRCFGSTHIDHSALKILDMYHIRWPVETGIKDLVENYFLNYPTGTSPEKVEAHYYCVMLARLVVDYFSSILRFSGWRSPEDWQCVLSTIRTTIFSNQNCQLSLHESGDLLITYLDGDPQNIKAHLAKVLQDRKDAGLNQVSWWGGRGVRVEVKDQYA